MLVRELRERLAEKALVNVRNENVVARYAGIEFRLSDAS
jgi:hypothetical protein